MWPFRFGTHRGAGLNEAWASMRIANGRVANMLVARRALDIGNKLSDGTAERFKCAYEPLLDAFEWLCRCRGSG